MSEAARSRRSNIRFEPQLDIPRVGGAAAEDPLAELARLVGQEDPFRNALRSPANSKPEAQRFHPNPSRFAAQDGGMAEGEASRAYGHDGFEHSPEQPAGSDHPYPDEDHWSAPTHDQSYGDGAVEDGHSDQAHGAYDPTSDNPYDLQNYAAPPLTPDLWAEGGEPAPQRAYGADAGASEAAASPRAPRRPLIVLASVLVLTGGGLAATFLARSGTSATARPGAAPTIMAAAGPNKIKLADTSSNTTPEDADSALLSKNGASGSGPAKVVDSQEQPIDLTQLPKAAAAPEAQSSVDATPTGSASPFPEPRKVKTFLVRPDGTMIASPRSGPVSAPSGVAALNGAAMPQVAGVAGAPATEVASATSVAPRPSTPKTSTRTATTPKAPPTSIADLASAGAPDLASKATQAASPGANAQSPSKPIEVADAAVSDGSPAVSTGAFALQLAAAPNEQDARSIFLRLQKKYSRELGSFKPTFRKAESGNRSVYRVRVGNLSQEQAKSLCARLQSSGGPCFVVHN